MDAPIRTKPLSPSKLFLALGCKLRYLFETETNDLDRVSGSVSLFLGRAVHTAIHAVAKKELIHSHDAIRQYLVSELLASAGAEKTVRSILDAVELALSEKYLVTPSRLADCVRIAFDVSKAKHEIGSSSDASALSNDRQARSAHETIKPAYKASTFGPEVRLTSKRFNLAGQADSVERLMDGTVRITDFKTGNAHDETGKLRPEYRLQIGAYAVIVRELYSNVPIMLKIVAADGVWEEKFTPAFSNEIETVVQTLSETIPIGARNKCTQLATTGENCFRCGYRPSCPAYKSWAPGQWSQSGGDLPLDTWGIVDSLEKRSERLVDVRIIDDAGRHVRILAIPNSMFVNLPTSGDHLELYELKSLETGGRGKYPQNFYIVNTVHPIVSAFSALSRTSVSAN